VPDGGTAVITDAEGNQWGLAITSAGKGYQVTMDGVVDQTTANLVQLAYVNGTVWQENTQGNWYSKTLPAGAWSAPTTIDPLTGTVQPVTLTWAGGGTNAGSNPADWSPALAPQAGDSLVMGSGTMNLSGNALAGDTLTLAPAAAVTIDTAGTTALDLANYEPGNTVAINADPSATLTLNADLISANLTASGGTIAFIGTSTFAAFKTVLDDNLAGSGTVQLFGGNATGETMEVNGSVGGGLSFDIGAGAVGDAGLRIDQPASFRAAVTLQSAGFVAFMGIQATSGDLLNGMLTLYDGSTLVAAVRLADTANSVDYGGLQLQQTSFGVSVSVGYGDNNQPGGHGTVLPLHI
jgi:hypothetical protein